MLIWKPSIMFLPRTVIEKLIKRVNSFVLLPPTNSRHNLWSIRCDANCRLETPTAHNPNSPSMMVSELTDCSPERRRRNIIPLDTKKRGKRLKPLFYHSCMRHATGLALPSDSRNIFLPPFPLYFTAQRTLFSLSSLHVSTSFGSGGGGGEERESRATGRRRFCGLFWNPRR